MNSTKIKRKERKILDKEWRIKALERDNYQCVICGKKERVNVHHIISRSVLEFRHDLDNAICLCPLHHLFDRKLSAHKGGLMFVIWFCLKRQEQFHNLTTKAMEVFKWEYYKK